MLATDQGRPPQGTLELTALGSVPSPPRGVAWPRAFTFMAPVASDPPPQRFELRNDGGSAMRFESAPGAAWLAADPPQGSVAPGESVEVSVRVTGLLSADIWRGLLTLTLSGPGGPVAPLELPVTFVAVPDPGPSGGFE